MTRSIELFEQAIALDPDFADAHAGLADANLLLYNFGLRSYDEVLPKARQSVSRALQLNPKLAEAYTSQALIQLLADHDWPAAEQSLRRALELDPHNASALLRYGFFLAGVGSFDQALAKLSKANEIDPLSPMVQADIHWCISAPSVIRRRLKNSKG